MFGVNFFKTVTILLIASPPLSVHLAKPEVHVISLNDNTFKTQIESSSFTFVMFYTPHCPHCRALKPGFEKAAQEVKTEDPLVHFAKVNCEGDGKYICDKYSIEVYPTLVMFKNGEFVEEYAGHTETDKLLGYIRRRRGASSKVMKAIADFSSMLESPDDIEIVAFLLPRNSKLDDPFTYASEEIQRKRHRPGTKAEHNYIKFSNVENSAVGLDKKEMMVLYRPKILSNKFEPDFVIYEGALNENDIEKFIEEEMHGLVGFRNKKSFEDFEADAGQPLVVIYFDVDFKKNSKGTHYWRNRVLKTAQDFRKDFTFAVSSIVEFKEEIENKFGSKYTNTKSEKPIVTATNEEGKQFLMDGEFTTDAFAEFLTKLKKGQLTPLLKSAKTDKIEL